MKSLFSRRFLFAFIVTLFLMTPLVLIGTPLVLQPLSLWAEGHGMKIENIDGSLLFGVSAQKIEVRNTAATLSLSDVHGNFDWLALWNENRFIFRGITAKEGRFESLSLNSSFSEGRLESLEFSAEQNLIWTGLSVRLPGQWGPLTLQQPLDVNGDLQTPTFNLSMHTPDKKARLQGATDSFRFHLENIDMRQIFQTDLPVMIDQADMPWPSQWNSTFLFTPEHFKEMSQQESRLRFRWGDLVLNLDKDCGCFKDDHDVYVVKREIHAEDPSLPFFTLALNDYRQEPVENADEELLSLLLWSRGLKQLDDKAREQLAAWKPHYRIQRPPPLPSAENPFLDDYRLLKKVTVDEEIMKIFSLIKRSVRTGSPAEVLYFSSLISVMGQQCDKALPWLSELTSLSTSTAIQAKTFSLLARCEADPLKKQRLLETAATYAPRDRVIEAFLISAYLSGDHPKKYLKRARKFVTRKDLSDEELLPVRNALVRLKALPANMRLPASH